MGRGGNKIESNSELQNLRNASVQITPEDLRIGDKPLLLGPVIADGNDPLLLLDIDGVLSPLNPEQPEKYELVTAGYEMHFNPQLPEHLKDFLSQTTPVWATTWEETANQNIGLRKHLGLPELAWLDFRSPLQFDLSNLSESKNTEPFSTTRKLNAVSVLARAYPNRPLIWCEDDIEEDALRWAKQRNETTPTLICSPERSVGLGEADFSAIQEFLFWGSS